MKTFVVYRICGYFWGGHCKIGLYFGGHFYVLLYFLKSRYKMGIFLGVS